MRLIPRRVTTWAMIAWSLLMIAPYVWTVDSSCSDPERDCGAAIAFGFAVAVMIWLAGMVVLLAIRLVASLVRRRRRRQEEAA